MKAFVDLGDRGGYLFDGEWHALQPDGDFSRILDIDFTLDQAECTNEHPFRQIARRAVEEYGGILVRIELEEGEFEFAPDPPDGII